MNDNNPDPKPDTEPSEDYSWFTEDTSDENVIIIGYPAPSFKNTKSGVTGFVGNYSRPPEPSRK